MAKMHPLAFRVRPTKIEDVIGQEHLLGENGPIRKMVENNRLSSMLLFGPPGIGKTTIAKAIAGSTNIPFRSLNAVTSNKKDLVTVAEEAETLNTSILLYIDEIHRFSKTQLEFLLPFMEDNTLIVIGSTTEGVFHSLPKAILSRSSVFQLYPLTPEQVLKGLKRAINDKQNGLGNYEIEYTDECLLFLSESTGGDMRSALNILETVIIMNLKNNKSIISVELLEKFMEKKYMTFSGENSKFDHTSAFMKSIRGADVDASLYYLAILMEAGEFESIYRRLLCSSIEDNFGNLNALHRVLSVINASERLGYPENRIVLSAAVIELCLSPKSNSAILAIDAALEVVRSGKSYEPPKHLRDGHYIGAKTIGNAQNYLYPHNFPVQKLGAWVYQQYLPEELDGMQFYHPKEIGHEKALFDMYNLIQAAKEIVKNNNK